MAAGVTRADRIVGAADPMQANLGVTARDAKVLRRDQTVIRHPEGDLRAMAIKRLRIDVIGIDGDDGCGHARLEDRLDGDLVGVLHARRNHRPLVGDQRAVHEGAVRGGSTRGDLHLRPQVRVLALREREVVGADRKRGQRDGAVRSAGAGRDERAGEGVRGGDRRPRNVRKAVGLVVERELVLDGDGQRSRLIGAGGDMVRDADAVDDDAAVVHAERQIGGGRQQQDDLGLLAGAERGQGRRRREPQPRGGRELDRPRGRRRAAGVADGELDGALGADDHRDVDVIGRHGHRGRERGHADRDGDRRGRPLLAGRP